MLEIPMTKAKTKAQEPEVQKPAEVEQAEQVVVGDGSGEALPEVAQQPADQVGETTTQSEVLEPEQAGEPEDVIDALVLCDGSLDGVTRFKAGMVLQGIPEPLAAANSHWLDVHPAAVDHAQNNGAEVVTYTQEA